MTSSRIIKVWISVVCLATSMAAPAPAQPGLTLDIIDMAAISRMTPQQLEALAEGLAAEEIMRTKRSSAQAALTSVVSKASSGLQSKVGLLGQASSFISSASSSSKSHDEHEHEHSGYSYEPQESKVDFWGLKKSILYTLFQAVKAITGGVTILKGQLIKGGGALAATLGRVISSKGDVVSNFGKKIVSSAALSHKKPHAPVYGPPPSHGHGEYPPSAYGAPTASAHYSAPSAPAPGPGPISTGYAAPAKYPSSLDGGRGRLQAVVGVLAPLDDAHHNEILSTAHSGHALENPSNLVDTVYSAVQNALPPPPPPLPYDDSSIHYQAPPLHHPVPPFKPMSWTAVNSYGEPAAAEAFPDYDPRNPHPPFQQHTPDYYATNKLSSPPTKHVRTLHYKSGLTQDKIQKIRQNLKKIAALTGKPLQRSSEESPKFTGLEAYKELLRKCQLALLPTPVVTDNDIGVLSAEELPDMTSTTTTTSTTTESPTTESTRQKKDVQYFLRGNRIVIHG